MPYILLGAPAYQKYAEELKNCGFTPISLPSDERLNKIVNTHADTLIFTDGKAYIANREYIKNLPEEITHHFIETDDFPYGEYPTDTSFNALVIGDKLFAREKSISASVTDHAKKSGYTFISVRQGYARCSTLALDNAAITADIGIGTSIAAQGIKVFIISSGHIALEYCKYGFIGGASFVDKARKTVYFFGDISLHPDGREIIGFIKKNGYGVVCLNGTLTDYGGAVIV
ncbi:MAG: hypothetical protein IJY93_07510 [Clostridia bacterium]|nr:hypothetical protein [Clostridia bacterium]